MWLRAWWLTFYESDYNGRFDQPRRYLSRENGMKTKILLTLLTILVLIGSAAAVADTAKQPEALSLTEIINRVEKHYDVPGFMAYFHQLSTIKAMDISDEASGKIYVKRPGKMRWEYEKPDRQIIITNGSRLWIYRPDDNQVMIGKSPAFFGDGKGAGFLADIKLLRRRFTITPGQSKDTRFYALKLQPVEESLGINEIYLYVSKTTFNVKRVVTVNPYGDNTTIDLINSRFDQIPDDNLFTFEIPEGTDVLTLDEQ
jgi:outer membrane lipoprotein carrier protein